MERTLSMLKCFNWAVKKVMQSIVNFKLKNIYIRISQKFLPQIISTT